MKNILIIGLAVVSSSVLAQEKTKDDIKASNEISKNVLAENNKLDVKQSTSDFELIDPHNESQTKKIEKIEDVVFDLAFDKNLLSTEELSCYVPFSSWHKSVNLYNKCNVEIKENIVNVKLMSLQHKIRVLHENNRAIFFDRITMDLDVNCTDVINTTSIKNWTYYNREDKNLYKAKLDNVNWFLTASSDKLGKELCEQKLPNVYSQAVEAQKLRQEKWKAVREKQEMDKKKSAESKNQNKSKKRIKKIEK